MRTNWLAAAIVIAGVAGATPAAAQRVWQDGRWVVMPRTSAPTAMRANPHRWTMRDGRWDAGYRAPGGWKAYRRLHRGARLPGFWMGNDYRIDDYLTFGLAPPPRGYSWVRYYDDAVLVDREGGVWDSRDDVSWGGTVAMASADDGYAHADSRAGAGYPPPRIEPVDPDDYYYDDRDDRYDGPPPPYEPGPYRGGHPDDHAPPPPPRMAPPPPAAYPACPQVCPTGYPAGMTWQNGAWVGNYGAGTTVVVIPGAVTTTTVTEYVTKSYRRAPKRVWRKARPRCGC